MVSLGDTAISLYIVQLAIWGGEGVLGKVRNFLSRFQIWPYPEPPKIENSNFLSRFQIWPYPEHPPPKKNWKL